MKYSQNKVSMQWNAFAGITNICPSNYTSEYPLGQERYSKSSNGLCPDAELKLQNGEMDELTTY